MEKDGDYIKDHKDGDWLKDQEALLLIDLAKELKPIEIKCSKCEGTGKVPRNTPFQNSCYLIFTAIFLLLGITGTVSFAIPALQPFANVSSFLMTMIFLIYFTNVLKGKY